MLTWKADSQTCTATLAKQITIIFKSDPLSLPNPARFIRPLRMIRIGLSPDYYCNIINTNNSDCVYYLIHTYFCLCYHFYVLSCYEPNPVTSIDLRFRIRGFDIRGNLGDPRSFIWFIVQSDSKLMLGFPWPINRNPDNNVESPCTLNHRTGLVNDVTLRVWRFLMTIHCITHE
jgi:hypothetical protein